MLRETSCLRSAPSQGLAPLPPLEIARLDCLLRRFDLNHGNRIERGSAEDGPACDGLFDGPSVDLGSFQIPSNPRLRGIFAQVVLDAEAKR